MTTTETTNASVLDELYEAFEDSVRDDGTRYTRLKDGCPEWIGSDLMLRIHKSVDDRMPDDWIYQHAALIVGNMIGYDDPSDSLSEIADGLVDVYNGQLSAWLASHQLNLFLCDEAEEEFGEAPDMARRLMLGQYLALSRMADCIWAIVSERVEGGA